MFLYVGEISTSIKSMLVIQKYIMFSVENLILDYIFIIFLPFLLFAKFLENIVLLLISLIEIFILISLIEIFILNFFENIYLLRARVFRKPAWIYTYIYNIDKKLKQIFLIPRIFF